MPLVKLFANLRKAAGFKEIDLPGESLAQVLSGLSGQAPALASLLLENGQIRQHVIITVNGLAAQGLEAPLAEQDVVAIFPPIAGGSALVRHH